MLCERCGIELEHGVTLPQWARFGTWVVAGEERRATPLVRRVFKILWSRRGAGPMSKDRLMILLYGMREIPPNDKIVYVILHRLRVLLRGSGWRIACDAGTGWSIKEGELPAGRTFSRRSKLIARGTATMLSEAAYG